MELSREDKDSFTVDEVAVVVPIDWSVLGSMQMICFNLPLNNVCQSIVLNWNVGILLSN